MDLKKGLGLFDATAIGIGSIVGAGIFVVTGVAAGTAGPGLLISIVIGATIAGLSALSFSELASYMPKEGGAYEFARVLVSPLAGFIAGWMWLMSNVVVGAAVAIGFAGYLNTFLNIQTNVTAALACLGVTFINYLGARESSIANNVLVVIKLAILAFFVFFGIGFVTGDNYAPFAPNGGIGIMEGAALMFFAFQGFARITIVSEEVIDPRRTIPRAIALALGISTVVYIMVAFTAIGLAGSSELASSSSPLSDAALVESDIAASVVSIGALAATLGVLLTTVLGLSRISFAMARNGDMPGFLGTLHPKRSVPFIAVLVFGLTMAAFASFSTLLQAVAMSNFAALVYYAIANLAALRMEKRTYPRVVPVLGLVTCLALIPFLTMNAWVVGSLVLVMGVLLYGLMNWRRRAHSVP